MTTPTPECAECAAVAGSALCLNPGLHLFTDEDTPDGDEGYHCWVCDALAAPVLPADGNWTGGTYCGCDDHGYDDGSDGIWR